MNEITRDLAKGKQAKSRYKIIMASLSRFVMNLRIFFSIVGILSGLSAVFVFGIKFNNWNAALWGLLSAVPASLTFALHVCYIRNVWQSYPYRLKYMVALSCIFQFVGIITFFTYLDLGYYFQQGWQLYDHGFFLTSIWCFMTWFWGLLLLYFTRSYRQLLCDVYTILPTEALPMSVDDWKTNAPGHLCTLQTKVHMKEIQIYAHSYRWLIKSLWSLKAW